MTNIEEIAKGLSSAQKRYLTSFAVWKQPTGHKPPQWMAFPPPNTHQVLIRRGLICTFGRLTGTGLAARKYLMENDCA